MLTPEQDFTKPAVLTPESRCVCCGRDHRGYEGDHCADDCPMYWEGIGIEHPETPNDARIVRGALVKAMEALVRIMELPGEINPSNYNHDDACALNTSFCEGWSIADTALAEINELLGKEPQP